MLVLCGVTHARFVMYCPIQSVAFCKQNSVQSNGLLMLPDTVQTDDPIYMQIARHIGQTAATASFLYGFTAYTSLQSFIRRVAEDSVTNTRS
jgi:hypothetical protein